MAEIALELAAAVLQSVECFVLDAPAAARRSHRVEYRGFVERRISGPGPAGFRTVRAHFRVLRQVRAHVEPGLVQGRVARPAEFVRDSPLLRPFGLLQSPRLRAVLRPVEREPAVAGFGAEEIAQVPGAKQLDVRALRGRAVLQDDGLRMGMLPAAALREPAHRVPLAIVLARAVLFLDHLRRDGKDDLPVRMRQGSGERPAAVARRAVSMPLSAAGGAADLVRGKILRSVQRRRHVAVERRGLLRNLAAPRPDERLVEAAAQLPVVDPVQPLPLGGVGGRPRHASVSN